MATYASNGTAVLLRRACFLLALVSFILVLANVGLIVTSRHLRDAVTQRQVILSQDEQVRGLAKQIIGAIGNLAVGKDDAQLKTLLSNEGFKINPANPAGAAFAGAANSKTPAKR